MNRKIWLGITGLVLIMALGGAWAFAAGSGDALSYYPLGKPGNKWEYQLTVGDQNAGTMIYGVTQPEGNTLVVGIALNGSMFSIVSYQESEQGLLRVKELSAEDVINYTPPQLILPAIIEKGKKWDWASEDGKRKETDTISSTQEKVTVLAGSFDTILVSCEGIDAKGMVYSDKSWFAKGIGMVREEYTYNGKITKLELIRYQVK